MESNYEVYLDLQQAFQHSKNGWLHCSLKVLQILKAICFIVVKVFVLRTSYFVVERLLEVDI
jgi:hypothetical protein